MTRTAPRLICLLTLAATAGIAGAQSAIFSNGSADPYTPALAGSDTSASGVPAPAGFLWSEAANDTALTSNATGGFSTNTKGVSGAYRFADDFVVGGPQGWIMSSIALYAYQTGAAGGVSPFAAVNVRIWSGRPGDVGSVVVFGDTTTNRLIASTETNMYRIFNTAVPPAAAAETSRLIWRTDVNLGGVILPPGTYWLDWQYTTAVAGAEAFSPPVTIAGARTQPGWNAIQFKTSNDVTAIWTGALDLGKPATAADVAQDLPFIVFGFGGTLPCNADFDGDGDSGTDADIEAFFACLGGDCCPTCGPADFNADGDTGTDADIESFFRVLGGGVC